MIFLYVLFNNNIRCIEMGSSVQYTLKNPLFNNNIRCIEINRRQGAKHPSSAV